MTFVAALCGCLSGGVCEDLKSDRQNRRRVGGGKGGTEGGGLRWDEVGIEIWKGVKCVCVGGGILLLILGHYRRRSDKFHSSLLEEGIVM